MANLSEPRLDIPHAGKVYIPSDTLSAPPLARTRSVMPHDSVAPIEPLEIQEHPSATSMSKAMLNKERMYFITVCLAFALGGWNESVPIPLAIYYTRSQVPFSASTGPLLPRLQSSYHVISLFNEPQRT